jgi:hypothetical protein
MFHAIDSKQNGRSQAEGERHPRVAVASELGELITALRLSRSELARLFGYAARTARHWVFGSRVVPHEVIILLRLVYVGKITIADIADATVRPQYGFESVIEPTADQKSAAEVGVGIDQLSSRMCRWPLWGNVPRDARLGDQMRFCGKATVASSPYCSEHTTTAARCSPGRPRSTFASSAPGGVIPAHRL